MNPHELESYLHEQIPLSQAMAVRVVSVSDDSVVLGADLAPNINHRETLFGGSASAIAILAAWSLVHSRLHSAGMARGKKRMFAVWSRAITPNFVEVTLNSPSTDALGRSGMSGQVDQHFFERFGGAMLYSLFSDGMDYVMRREELRSQERDARNAAANGDNNTVYYNNQGGALRNLDRTRSTADRAHADWS